MGLKIETGCGIQEILGAGYEMKIVWRDQGAIVLKLMVGCGK